ncbi:MAG TPA: ribonuclease Z [Blastocatellia bacterium]|nr:ribonuclease Z [Blastocatellia bacterium]
MRVIPLGTSSGKPTLKRNVSALAVAREGEWLLFDCGEGTQTQIIRAGLNPSRLVAIFITHLHGDHFNGLSGLLSTMGLDRRTRELTLVGPPGINEYLDTLARLKILFVNYPLEVQEIGSVTDLKTVYEAADYTVTTHPLDHRLFALGYRVQEHPRPGRFNLERARELGVPEGPMFRRLQLGENIQLSDGRIVQSSDVMGPERPGKAVAYCTDTRPFDGTIKLARDVDLLIHEATYTEELTEEAHDYGHSTAAQAASIARDAGARRLLITHYSTRYPDVTPLVEEARAIFPDTLLAQDLVEVEV